MKGLWRFRPIASLLLIALPSLRRVHSIKYVNPPLPLPVRSQIFNSFPCDQRNPMFEDGNNDGPSIDPNISDSPEKERFLP